MSLKLFRSTEFAQSRNFSPEQQRSAISPVWIVVLTGVWLALAGNWILWRALVQVPELGVGAVTWIGLRTALLIASANCALLGICMWRWTLKPAATALMLVTAWAGTVTAIGQWQLPLSMALLAVLPGWWLSRTAVRRLAPWRNLVQAGQLVAGSSAVFALVLLFSFKDLATLTGKHAELRQLVSPYSAIGAVGSLEKTLLPRKQ